MLDINIIKKNNQIKIEKLGKAHVMATESTFNTIADYDFNDKVGYIYQYTNTVPTEYKRYTNWKKAVKRIFNIDVE